MPLTPEGHPFTGAVTEQPSHPILSGLPHSLTVREVDEGHPLSHPPATPTNQSPKNKFRENTQQNPHVKPPNPQNPP